MTNFPTDDGISSQPLNNHEIAEARSNGEILKARFVGLGLLVLMPTITLNMTNNDTEGRRFTVTKVLGYSEPMVN